METQTNQHSPRKGPLVREAVGVFDDFENLQAALDDLEENGFMRQELSVLAHDKTLIKNTEYRYRGAHKDADNPDAPRTVPVPEEIIGEAQGSVLMAPVYVVSILAIVLMARAGGSLGEIAAAGALAAVGAGIIGLLLAKYVAKRHAESIRAQIRRGGMILWVALRGDKMQSKALRILRKHAARNVHVHKVPL